MSKHNQRKKSSSAAFTQQHGTEQTFKTKQSKEKLKYSPYTTPQNSANILKKKQSEEKVKHRAYTAAQNRTDKKTGVKRLSKGGNS